MSAVSDATATAASSILADASLVESNLIALWSQAFLRPQSSFVNSLLDGTYVTKIRLLVNANSASPILEAIDCLEEACVALQGCLTNDSANELTNDLQESLQNKQSTLPDSGHDVVRLALEVDYNRLFIGPGEIIAPPYESFYRTNSEQARGRLRDDAERFSLDAYRNAGYTVLTDATKADIPVEFSDHIAVQLEFLSKLAVLEHEALAHEDAAEAYAIKEQQEAFINDHLAFWLPPFVQRIKGGAKLTFYPAVARCIACYIIGDC